MTFTAPIRFQPLYQTRVWGGRRLQSLFGRALPSPDTNPIGESWEISDRPGEQSSLLVQSDPAAPLTLHDLWNHHREPVFGAALAQHPAPRFPLLLKILDACDDLSIQVHPPAAIATSLGGEAKTEMWFIAHAAPGAKLYVGVHPGVTRETMEAAICTGTVADLVQVIEPSAGDALFIPSGRLHAIGAGLVIFEIQQNSDTTYRVFDWNRSGLDGKPRALHIAESLACIDFTDTAPRLQQPGPDGTLAECEHFHVRQNSQPGPIGQAGEFVIVTVVRGAITLGHSTLAAGDFVLVPACLPATSRRAILQAPDSLWLEIRVPL